MMGRTHYILGILYYILFCILPVFAVVNFRDRKEMIIGILAAAIGAIFPDADSDHSIINSRNPIFKSSNKVINYYRAILKKTYAFIFFGVPGALIIFYMYSINSYPRGLIVFVAALFILAFNGAMVGEKIYVPILTKGLKSINNGAAKIKKAFMMMVYLSVGFACIYFSRGSIQGIIWGVIFIVIAIFPHRTFLHSPEGIILTTIGVRYLEKGLDIPNITTAFFIGYFSHLYLADIFTNSGVPISTIPLILRTVGLHQKLKKNKLYKRIYSILDKKLAIPIIKTGSKLGNIIEGLYVFGLLALVFFIMMEK